MHTTTFPASKKPNQRITTDSQPTHRSSENKTTNNNNYYYYYRETRRTQQNFATTNPCTLARLKRHHGHDHKYTTLQRLEREANRRRGREKRLVGKGKKMLGLESRRWGRLLNGVV
jgi:hypothetical protein